MIYEYLHSHEAYGKSAAIPAVTICLHAWAM